MILTLIFFSLTETDQNVDECIIGLHLANAETALTDFVKCKNSEMIDFHTLDEDLQVLIVQRSCLQEIDANVKICKNHEEFLGKKFYLKYNPNKNCLYPSHQKSRWCKTLRPAFPLTIGDQKKQSMFLYSTYGIVLPFDSKVCLDCKKDCNKKLASFIEEKVKSPQIRRSILEPTFQMDDSQPTSASSQLSIEIPSQQSTHSEYKMPSQDLQKEKKAHLDSLIKANDIDVSVNSCLYKTWEESNDSRHRQTLDYAGAAVAAALQTIAPNEPGLLYHNLVESNYVQKHLDDEVPMSAFYEEVVNTANCLADSRDLLKQYLSTLYKLPGISFEILNQFNAKPNSEGIEEDSDNPNFDRSKIKKGLFFIFDFNYHLWISAVKHRLRFGHGMAPVIREKTFKWYYDIELLTIIFDFVVSPMNTQRNSYGVFNIKQEDGQKYTIGRVIRLQNNSDLVKSIQAHLKGLGLEVPSASFLFKFLTYLPAASLKEMKGVNNIQEDAMRAFTTLDNVVETYSNSCALSEDERQNLKSCLSASKTYLKTEYYNNLSISSPYLSHCVSCLVSDPNDNPDYVEECCNKHTTIKCEKCDLTYNTIAVLQALMEKYKEEQLLSIYDAAVIEKRLNDSKAAILQYQAHLVKVFTQEGEWQRLMDKRDPETAFFEIDWGMKILPRRHRGKQSEWYGQNGMSNHIGCFYRIVPNSFEEDGVTPKTFRKQYDAYVSLVDDSSKQDALTTAAIVKENLIIYKKNNPQVKRVYIRSDNAGCYKTAKLIHALYSLDIDDLEIMGYVFSAPCDGKSICDTYAGIVKHHLTKMVSTGKMDITNPRQLAEAINTASGVANVIVMIGKFSFQNDIHFKKMDKITDLNTFIFRKNSITVWKQGRYGNGHEISMKKIPFPSTFDYEIIGSENPRRNEKPLLYRMDGEKEEIKGRIDDLDDEFEGLEAPVNEEDSIYRCPNPNCDAEYLTLGYFQNHLISKKCFQKTKLRTQSIGSYFQKCYIDKYSLSDGDKLTISERRYKPMIWDDDLEFISLLETFSWDKKDTENLFSKGFAVKTIRIKNAIHDDVRAFVKQKFDEGEMTKRHMSYPKIVSAIEDEKDAFGNPRFFPNKWLDAQQVSYLISKFIKEKGSQSNSATVEPTNEDIFIDSAEENYVRRRDAIQTAVEQMQADVPLNDQCHPILNDNGYNICSMAKDYYDNQNGKDSWIMNEDFDEIAQILQSIDIQPEGRNRRKAAGAILKFVKNQCTCIPKRRKKDA